MADFRKVEAANQSAADLGEPVDTNWGDLDGAIAAAARRQFAETDPRRVDISGAADSAADAGDNIDAGGGWNPATAGDFGDDIDAGGGWNPAGGVGSGRTAKKNALDDYANYTYGLSLHYIPISTYNSLASNGGNNYNASNNVLIASAGRHDNSGFSRRANFQEDFYFENLKLTTIIGYNSRNRGSNVVDLTFTIIEPYGISLLDRLLKVATEEGIKNWNQMPFMLQIDFFGNTDEGEPEAIEGHTKYIPIKVIACNIKASTRGSEYKFSAVPYNHQAFHETVGSSPAFLSVVAGTVKEFFKSDKDAAGQADAITAQQQYFADQRQTYRNENKLDARDILENNENYGNINKQESDVKSVAFKVGSYAAALNSYQVQLQKKGYQEHADKYEFTFDSGIGESKIVSSNLNDVKSAPMATKFNEKTKMADGLRDRLTGKATPLALDKQAISINAGTSIIDVINLAIRSSTYITDQINPTNSQGVGNKPINFYKIIPTIEIGSFDNKRKVYQKTFKYHIKKFSYYNTRFPFAARGVPTSWEKEYNYMYTGKNNAVLDFNIEFDAMFYTAMTANAAKFKKDETDGTAEQKDKVEGSSTDKSNQLGQIQYHYRVNQTTVNDKLGNNDVKNIGASDLYQSIMTNSRGDMINVKLKITGDPDFIKQDDYYADLGTSIPMDAQDVFVRLFFKSPSDIDQDTGLYDVDSYPTTQFSGIYKVITVENIFERGQFTQSLDLIRLAEQTADGRASKTVDENRQTGNAVEDAALNQLEASEVMPEPASITSFVEDGTPTPRKEAPEVDSSVKNYFDGIKKLQNNVKSAPTQSVDMFDSNGYFGGPL